MKIAIRIFHYTKLLILKNTSTSPDSGVDERVLSIWVGPLRDKIKDIRGKEGEFVD